MKWKFEDFCKLNDSRRFLRFDKFQRLWEVFEIIKNLNNFWNFKNFQKFLCISRISNIFFETGSLQSDNFLQFYEVSKIFKDFWDFKGFWENFRYLISEISDLQQLWKGKLNSLISQKLTSKSKFLILIATKN